MDEERCPFFAPTLNWIKNKSVFKRQWKQWNIPFKLLEVMDGDGLNNEEQLLFERYQQLDLIVVDNQHL